MKKSLFFLLALLLAQTPALAQHSHEHGRVITFPDIPGYQTLLCDFHIHTVFSDGSVWPNIRVQEAIRDGLDAISLTEHLEYQPHINDIPHPDRNRSHHIATEVAEGHDLIVIQGAEVTRDMPPGHSNAIFITDANKLMMDDPFDVFREVKRQGGFVFWDHPNWTAQRADGVATLTDMHRQLIEEGLLHGIEVVNDHTYSDEALAIAYAHNLTVVGTSDIHGLVDWQYEVPEGGHRPLMLVFAEERSEAGIKAAMQTGRTAAYYRNQLIGKGAYLVPLLEASLVVEEAWYGGDATVLSVVLKNNSDMPMMLKNTTDYTLHNSTGIVQVPAHHEETVQVKTVERVRELSLTFEVLNAITAPSTTAHIEIPVTVE
ncbi:MAG: Sb-PDE family phosphodiesterase [Bacteroidota bacterium]